MRRLILFLAVLLVGCEPKYCFDHDPPPLPKCALPSSIRLALVLGGGGARGMAHVGVLQEFEEAGIPIDLIVGCSVGSMVGALYADCPSAEHVKNILQPIKKWDILDLNIFKCRYGLIQGKSLCRFLDSNLRAKRFEELQIPFVVVATDLRQGEIVCLGSGPLIPAVQASCSFPFFFNPVPLYDRILVDGGVANPVPAVVACEANALVVVVVDLCELLPRTCPTNLFEVGTRCAEIKFNKQSEVCLQDADVIIKPAVGTVGTFDDGHSTMLYNAGREAARKAMPEIKSFLSSQCGMEWESYES
jgi:NTE family protein